MFEMIINPRRTERKPWELFFVGFVYAALSVILVNWIFAADPVLSKYSGILVVTFSVMFSMPFVYFTLRLEESKDVYIKNSFRLLKEHGKALMCFLWLFLGFIIAFSAFYIIINNTDNYKAQIETYCSINQPGEYENCVASYDPNNKITGNVSGLGMFESIFINNIYVLIFTIIFSIIFGAGGIFILAWNASVISAAMVIFSEGNIINIPLGLIRYMIHGFPEISAYFIGTLAGGIIGLSVIKKEFKTDQFWNVLYDALLLIIIAIIIVFIAAVIEVFITPKFF
ncbi:MAG TPA: stage II sporulation protein M [Candidatus Paceibacterota bacterium]|nr:stage II sporulation protein M [Candidatus Paceibacterota bacterium]